MSKLLELYNMLESFDWYHEMSDDRGVDRRGVANWQKIVQFSAQSAELTALREAYFTYKYTGKPFSEVQSPTPEKPKE